VDKIYENIKIIKLIKHEKKLHIMMERVLEKRWFELFGRCEWWRVQRV